MSEDTMQAVIGEELGDPENYHLQRVPRPVAKAGEVLIKTQVAGMGFVDALVARGGYQVKPQVPYCPGLEFAGRVASVGEGVTELTPGDSVTASAFGGGLAEYAAVKAGQAVKLPEGFDLRAAAGFLVNYITAWHGLLDRGQLQAGETVLVLGAAGGTGIAAIQVARMAGARVIAGASTAEKRAFAETHGAHASVDYTQEGWRDTLKTLTDGAGVDVVFDPVGAELLQPAFRSLAWRGRYLVIGFAGGPIPALPINLALLKGAALIGVDYRQFGSVYEPEQALGIREQLFEAVEQGTLAPPVGQSFPLKEFRQAMRLAGSRDGVGKTIIQVGE